MQMENEMQEREKRQEQALLEKSLREQQEHLDQMEQMRMQYEAKMAVVNEKLNTSRIAKQKPVRKQDYVDHLKKKAMHEKPSGSKVCGSGKKPKKPEPEELDEREGNSEEENEKSGDSEVEESSEEDSTKSCDSEEEQENEESDESCEEESENESDENERAASRKSSRNVVPHGLGRKPAGPTKAQLSARNGISRKLPIFSGKPEDWPLFIGSYETSNEACGYNNIENLVRLQECLKGPALESVRGQLLLPKSVPKVIEKLRQLYGRPEQLLHFHLEKVNRLDSPQAERLETFIPFGNAVEQLCDHLEAANLMQHLVNPLLLQSLLEKLPSSEKREWVRFKSAKKKVNLRTFSKFLSQIVAEVCEANAGTSMKAGDSRPAKVGRGGMKEKGALYNHSTPASPKDSTPLGNPPAGGVKPCKACKRTDHRLRFCQDFKAMSFADRMKVVEKGKLCRVCLNDHGRAPCKFKIRCDVGECHDRHNPLLHPGGSRVMMNTHFEVQGTIIFRMIPVTLHSGKREVKTLAFLDEGASITLVERSLTNKLGVEGVHEPLTITWTSDVTRDERNSTKMNLFVSSSGSEGKLLLKAVQTVKQLLLPKQSIDAIEMNASYRYLRDVPFTSYSSQRPGMLIGLNNLHAIAPMNAKVGQPGEPIAVKSKLGWTIYGPTKRRQEVRNFVGYHHPVSNEDLHNLLREHYALEESVVGVSQESEEEKRAQEILERTTVRVGDRFETGMLWKVEYPKFPNSYPMAVRRLKQLEQRLGKTPELFAKVRMQIEEYQQKGYTHLATPEELAKFDPSSSWFLPISVVLNPKKPGKVRIVWDAAAMVNSVSLNSQLLTGPDLLTPLPKVINRFRERPIGFGGDIREMYHQLRIRAADKSAQLFLFRNSPEEAPRVYVMDVATFGSKCSPSQAQFIKNKNAMEFSVQFSEAAEAIIEKHYVDDYFDSVDTVEKAIDRAKECSSQGARRRECVAKVHFNRDKETGTERVLGIVWDPTQDEFSFSMEHRQNVKPYLLEGVRPTKRIVLSSVMGFFDPLGLLTPFTVYGKMLVQDLWRAGCDWDDEIDDGALDKWDRWTGLLPMVTDVRIPRCYFGRTHSSSIESLELHIFTDASIHAYGCAAYFRAIVDGRVRCSLAMSRSKVCPLKLQSVPRLELMAAVLGARMIHTVKNNHSLPIEKHILWSDSQTVLSWIRSDQHKYNQFVAFRIGEVVELTTAGDWRYVPSEQNIADVVTKWGPGPPLSSDGPWFSGPEFLHWPESMLPKQEKVDSDDPEEMKACVLFHHGSLSSPLINVQVTTRWEKLIRIAANVFRFIDNCRRKSKGEQILVSKANNSLVRLIRGDPRSIVQPLRQEELKLGEYILLRQAQRDGFPEEVKILEIRRDYKVTRKIEKSSWLYKLRPIIDTDGVIRLDGRLALADVLPFDKRYPIILPRQHDVTKMIIQNYHEKFGHANRETVFNELRQGSTFRSFDR
ncbi:uncharacterized protein LOC134222107 [Armigeres subalbatus]|uniref:uncharacterized protein LOC134222107 n=1 Tax=Armigeres subalbatus TaxID=124917 RepID=UPI002ED2F3C2